MLELRKSNIQGLFLASAAMALLASARPLSGGEVTIAGTATGAFGAALPADTAAFFGLNYYGSAFSVSTAGGFAGVSAMPTASFPNTNNFGALSLASTAQLYTGTTFTLALTFDTPSGITGGQTDAFNSTLTGVVRSGGGGIYLSFADPQRSYVFNDGSQNGWFTLQMLDVSIAPGQTQALTGFILDGSATAAYGVNATGAADVPEGACWPICGIALCTLAARSLAGFGYGSYNCFGWRRRGMLSSSAEATTD